MSTQYDIHELWGCVDCMWSGGYAELIQAGPVELCPECEGAVIELNPLQPVTLCDPGLNRILYATWLLVASLVFAAAYVAWRVCR